MKIYVYKLKLGDLHTVNPISELEEAGYHGEPRELSKAELARAWRFVDALLTSCPGDEQEESEEPS